MSKKNITYSAPAKVILLGEHSVVYGKCAVISAINRRVKFSIEEGYQKKNDNLDFIADIVKEYLKKEKIPMLRKHYRTQITSKIPRNRGLGSSGAYAVVSVAGFLEFFTGRRNFELEVINNLAFKVEKKFHGNPSGVDQTTSCFGGLVFFRKEFEFLKGIYKLNFKIPKNIEGDLYLVDSGRPKESTAEMVKHVGNLYNRQPKETQDILNEMEKVTKRAVVSIMKEDRIFFDENLAMCGELLQRLGVVSQKTQELLIQLRQFGSCKVTGAGGIKKDSGFILASVLNKDGFIDFCKNNRLDVMKFEPSHTGLQRL